MPSAVSLAPVRSPRRARYLVPLGTPRRGELLAAVAVAAVVAGVLSAPLTLILAAAFDAVSKATRWRPLWLAVPAGCGVIWALTVGLREAVAGLRRGPAAAISAVATEPTAASRLPVAIMHGLPGQLPLALIPAACVAAVAWWLRWLHTDEWAMPAARPGLVSAWRRRQATASMRAGRMLTRDGVRLGVAAATGRPAVLGWSDAGGGVLVTGAAPGVLASGLHITRAAIRRRRAAIVVDLTGDPDLPGVLAAICEAVRAPMHVFGGAGGPRYEPRVPADPAQQAALAALPWGAGDGGAGTGAGVGLADVVRQRGVALFMLDTTGHASTARTIAGLVATDLASLYREGFAPDGLCWLTECAGVDPAAVAGLIAAGGPTAGTPAGLAPVLATAVPEPAARIAGQVNAAIVHRLADPGLAAELAPLTGSTIVPLGHVLARPGLHGTEDGMSAPAVTGHAVPFGTTQVPVVQAATLCTLRSGDFVLVAGLAAARAGGAAVSVQAPCRTVRGPLPKQPATPARRSTAWRRS